jgi:hypothetical protein
VKKAAAREWVLSYGAFHTKDPSGFKISIKRLEKWGGRVSHAFFQNAGGENPTHRRKESCVKYISHGFFFSFQAAGIKARPTVCINSSFVTPFSRIGSGLLRKKKFLKKTS